MPNARLQGHSPVDRMATDFAAVLQAAQALSWAQHGAVAQPPPRLPGLRRYTTYRAGPRQETVVALHRQPFNEERAR